MKRFLFILLFLYLSVPVQAAQTKYISFTVQSAQIPAAQADFPALIAYTHNDLRTVGNGGFAADAEGDDIRPYSNADCAPGNAITPYQKAVYIPTSGFIQIRTKIASFNVGSVIYLCWGDSGLGANGGSNTVWDTNYTLAMPLGDGTSLNVNDFSRGAHNGTNSGATATTGKIGGAAAFVTGSSQSIIIPNADLIGTLNTYTVTGWFKTANTADPGTFYAEGYQSFGNPAVRTQINGAGAGKINFFHRDDGGANANINSASNYSDDAWHWFTMIRYAANSFELFIDNSSVGTDSTTVGTITLDVANLGVLQRTISADYLTGALDEIERSKIARSANWNTTTFNNESAPGSGAFWTISAVTDVSGGVGSKPKTLTTMGVGRP